VLSLDSCRKVLGQSLKIDSEYFLLHFYGSHPVVFVTKETTLIQSNTTKVYFNSVGYP
jgi:hypothetical protein